MASVETVKPIIRYYWEEEDDTRTLKSEYIQLSQFVIQLCIIRHRHGESRTANSNSGRFFGGLDPEWLLFILRRVMSHQSLNHQSKNTQVLPVYDYYINAATCITIPVWLCVCAHARVCACVRLGVSDCISLLESLYVCCLCLKAFLYPWVQERLIYKLPDKQLDGEVQTDRQTDKGRQANGLAIQYSFTKQFSSVMPQ